MMFKFPEGISDFDRIITANYFYVDRSSHIRLIEEFGDQLLFLRPRRFGKSLLLSMLENYYDVAKASEFEYLFGHLAIGQNPTPQRHRYLVMKWDFSALKPPDDDKSMIKYLHDHLNTQIKRFADRYQEYFFYPIEIDQNNAISSFESSLAAVQTTPYKLYLLIDEYDSFANEVMSVTDDLNSKRYQTLLSAVGLLKSFFKAVESASSGRCLERVFITGVSPNLMNDMTSAYNAAVNIYRDADFNDLCGFKKREIKDVVTQIIKECGLEADNINQALHLIETFHEGYCFSDSGELPVYNPSLALYFLKQFQQYHQSPGFMLENKPARVPGKPAHLSKSHNRELVIF